MVKQEFHLHNVSKGLFVNITKTEGCSTSLKMKKKMLCHCQMVNVWSMSLEILSLCVDR